jgi:hypothetical protein
MKARETTDDRNMKYNLFKLHNNLQNNLIDRKLDDQFDLGIPCDIMLDILRY